MTRTYLTFDIGTTSLKTALIDDEGRALAVHTEEYTFRAPRPDWAEMSPESYWNAAKAGISAVFAESNRGASELAASASARRGRRLCR